MTRKEAVMAMLEGKKVRHKSSYSYMMFDGQGFHIYDDHSSKGIPVSLSLAYEDGYELYEPEPEPRYEFLYEVIDGFGKSRFIDKHGQFPCFAKQKFIPDKPADPKRKTGRTLKLNLDTWEIEAEGDGE